MVPASALPASPPTEACSTCCSSGMALGVYAMRIDPSTGQAHGEPFVVAHVHDASRQWGSTGYGSAVVRGIFVANLFQTTGNLWMTTLETDR